MFSAVDFRREPITPMRDQARCVPLSKRDMCYAAGR